VPVDPLVQEQPAVLIQNAIVECRESKQGSGQAAIGIKARLCMLEDRISRLEDRYSSLEDRIGWLKDKISRFEEYIQNLQDE
jgi:predicted  nucleic acid-binding Zn-ribbon protein